MNVAELRKLKQKGRTIEKFVQEFQRTARRSGYEGRALVEELVLINNMSVPLIQIDTGKRVGEKRKD